MIISKSDTNSPNPQTNKGHSGATDAVAYQISSLILTVRARIWGDRKVT